MNLNEAIDLLKNEGYATQLNEANITHNWAKNIYQRLEGLQKKYGFILLNYRNYKGKKHMGIFAESNRDHQLGYFSVYDDESGYDDEVVLLHDGKKKVFEEGDYTEEEVVSAVKKVAAMYQTGESPEAAKKVVDKNEKENDAWIDQAHNNESVVLNNAIKFLSENNYIVE